MRARTAPEPITAALTTVGDYKSRRRFVMPRHRQDEPIQGNDDTALPSPPPAQLAADAAPSASAFAAALISSTHDTPPEVRREQAQKLRRADLPAQGSLALTDRRV